MVNGVRAPVSKGRFGANSRLHGTCDGTRDGGQSNTNRARDVAVLAKPKVRSRAGGIPARYCNRLGALGWYKDLKPMIGIYPATACRTYRPEPPSHQWDRSTKSTANGASLCQQASGTL